MSEKDPLFDDAVALAKSRDTLSVSDIQRRLNLGYARAARIIDQLEKAGIVGQFDGSKPRKVLTPLAGKEGK